MALFRKKNTTTQIPELQEYYATQKKESTGVAWLLAFGSLIVTAALLVGLFMGGRWVYRKISNKDTKVATVQTVKPASDTAGQTPDSTTKQPTGTVTVPDVSTSIGGSVTTPQTSTAHGVSPSQSATTNTGAKAATTSVPNTGPSESIGLFVAIIVVSMLAHRSYLLRKTSKQLF